MGQGPDGPGPIWAPGPSLLGKHLTKNAPWKKESKLCFLCVCFETKKMRDVRTIILAAVSRRDLCYVSENEGFRFAKNEQILCPFCEKWSSWAMCNSLPLWKMIIITHVLSGRVLTHVLDSRKKWSSSDMCWQHVYEKGVLFLIIISGCLLPIRLLTSPIHWHPVASQHCDLQ